MTFKLLLIEDDRELRGTLRQVLEVEGYGVTSCASMADARAVCRQYQTAPRPDVVLLDLGLPDGYGADLLAAMRSARGEFSDWLSQVPIIIISAQGMEKEKIRLLDLGADDYLVKPFSIEELMARMRVALRHRGKAVQAALTHYQHNALTIDLTHRTVVRDGATVHLTPREFGLLSRLVRNAGQVVTHRQLLADVWGSDCVDHTHYLRLYMTQLRAKLEDDPSQPDFLMTEPGVGYRLVDPS